MWEEIPSVSTEWDSVEGMGFSLLLETGDEILLEDGGYLSLEQDVNPWEEIPTVTTVWT